MNLGVNPFLQFGLDATREQLIRNILSDISVVNYVPFETDMIGNPALDVGDVLSFSGGQADADRCACITSDSLKIGIHTFTNASAFTVADTDTKIISIEFATSEDNHAQFFGQVIVDVTADQVTRTATASGEVTIPAVNVNGTYESSSGSTDTTDSSGSTDTTDGSGDSSADSGTDSSSGDSSGDTSGDSSEDTSADTSSGSSAIGTTEEQTISVSLPVSWTEDGHEDVIFTFEFNDVKITVHYPQEHWCSGRHTICP
jgi:hypothetical protein